LKKVVDESELVKIVKKALKKMFDELYINQQAVASEKKAAGSSYFFEKLRY
jgi:hypothetical protein